jgi:sulfotransferase
LGVIQQFVALSGLPRTGSTLLSAILSQNPEIHAEGNSAVCQLMWDMQEAIIWNKDIEANSKNLLSGLIKPIPYTYYSDVAKPIVVDKCRSWTMPSNYNILKTYFDNSPKVIVLVRPLVEIVASFMALRKVNGWTGDLSVRLLDENTDPIMRSLSGVQWASKNNDGEFLFVTYDDLVDDTQVTLNRIYKHCEWKNFKHDLTNIAKNYLEDDYVYNLPGLHDIRPEISRRTVDIELSDEIIEKCNKLDEWSLSGSLC